MQKKFYFVFKWFWKYKIFSIIIFLFRYWLNNKISCLTFFLSRKSPVIRFSCPNIVILVLILHVLPLSCHFLFCSILVLLSFSPMFDLSYFFLLSNAFLFNVCHSDGCHPLRLHFLNILKGVFANNVVAFFHSDRKKFRYYTTHNCRMQFDAFVNSFIIRKYSL